MTRITFFTISVLMAVTTVFPLIFHVAARAADPAGADSRGNTYISGRVTAGDDGPVSGIVFIEKGRLYGKDFRYGGLIDREGRFSIKVDQGGDYGLHIYATGYIYFPLGIKVEEGKDNNGTYRLPPNPAASHAPVIRDVRFHGSGDSAAIRISVSDPDEDLSHQVLALNGATGRAFRMKPPSFVFPWTKNYPEGAYTVDLKGTGTGTRGVLNPEDWYFVAADNRCYNSPVMKYPFDPKSFIEAHSITAAGPETADFGKMSGEAIFRNNCSVCHYRDSTKTKVGPGFKGLFKRKKSPVQGFPMNESNVENQIRHGGTIMPPYEHLTDAELSRLIAYLKTL